MRRRLACLVMVLVGCGGDKDDGEPLGEWIAGTTWLYVGDECNGVSIAAFGYAETLTFPTIASVDLVAGNADCTIGLLGTQLRGSEVLTSTSTVQCTPDPCLLSYEMRAENGSSQFVNVDCPAEAIVSGIEVYFRRVDDRLVLHKRVGDDECLSMYRQ